MFNSVRQKQIIKLESDEDNDENEIKVEEESKKKTGCLLNSNFHFDNDTNLQVRTVKDL